MEEYYELPKGETEYLVEITLEDGCIFIFDSLTEEKDGWQITMPGGIQIICPHGNTFNSDNEIPTEEE